MIPVGLFFRNGIPKSDLLHKIEVNARSIKMRHRNSASVSCRKANAPKVRPGKISRAAPWRLTLEEEEERHGSSRSSQKQNGRQAIPRTRSPRAGEARGPQAVGSWRIWLDQGPAR